MSPSDDVIIFPYFYSQPGEPEFAYCENVALRSEFEVWHLRDKITKKVRDFWIQEYHQATSFSILAENENYLIARSLIENRVLLFFLNHVFSIEFTRDIWKRFKDLILTSKEENINTIVEHTLSWSVDHTKSRVSVQTKTIRRDSIILSIAEWLSLQEVLSTSG